MHPCLLDLTRHILLRPHRELPGLIPIPGFLSLPVLCLLAIYHGIVFTYARDLALALARPDLSSQFHRTSCQAAKKNVIIHYAPLLHLSLLGLLLY